MIGVGVIDESAPGHRRPYAGGMADVTFRKGHGTGNDFVVLPDPDDSLTLTPGLVRALCDRRFGIGADGVIRVAPGQGAWFMDYWNSDGSLADMCGNGARVFARHLVDVGVEQPGVFEISTRGGRRQVTVDHAGEVSVAMGGITGTDVPDVQVAMAGAVYPATAAFVPNPHAVVILPRLDELGDITTAVAGPSQAFPDAANIEFVEVLADDRVRMRVLERGSGETLSCGTGACAVAWVHSLVSGSPAREITVEVPGGEVRVGLADDVVLTGPATFVADGVIDAAWWSEHS